MTTLSASPFIVDSIWQRTRTSALVQITSLTALTVLSAQIVIPLPFTPIPLTMQTFAILFGAAVIGPVRSLIAQFAYLLLAAVGFPVLAGNKAGIEAIFGATAGYLFAFLVASYVVGLLAKKNHHKKIPRRSGWLSCGKFNYLFNGCNLVSFLHRQRFLLRITKRSSSFLDR